MFLQTYMANGIFLPHKYCMLILKLTRIHLVLSYRRAVEVKQVPFYLHDLGPTEQSCISDSLSKPILTTGSICREVENLISDYFNVAGAKLVNSWTNGAVASLLALGIGPGDEVIVPAMTFISTANAVELVGATPIFCDVSNVDLILNIQSIEGLISSKTKAVIVVNLYGRLGDIRALKSFLSPKGIFLIEDSAHSFESIRDGYKSGAYSDVAIFSFYATKNITCGEGGVIISNDKAFLAAVEKTVHHGMSASAQNRFIDGEYKHWDMEVLGTKANLPDILASILVPQLDETRIDSNLCRRENIANVYEDLLKNLPVQFLRKTRKEDVDARHLFPISVKPTQRDALILHLNRCGIGATVNYNAVHLTSYYKNRYKANRALSVSETWGRSTLSLPMYPRLTESEAEYVSETVSNFFAVKGNHE
jgi:dTDP-4-amino-4,6-dideoxygalactose transaminase